MKKLLLINWVVAWVCLPWVGASEGAVQLKTGVGIVQAWKADQHVYVKGDVGVSAGQLAGLEKWLDKNGKNWTVLLMNNASGERYADERGLAYHGMDAVEHAMGKGLPAKTGFGDLTHTKTQQANGAFFILFLQERKFSYYGSEVFETRGLGHRNWAGGLDEAAKRAMRNGGRIVEAAKGTVQLVEDRLEEVLLGEERRRVQARLAMEKLKAVLPEQIKEGRRELEVLASEVEKLREVKAYMDGDLLKPVVEVFRGELNSAEQTLGAGHVAAADQLVKQVRRKIAQLSRELRAFQGAGQKMDEMDAKLAVMKLHSGVEGREQRLQSLLDAMKKARAAHGRADRNYAMLFANVERGQADLVRQIEQAQKREQEEIRAQQRRDEAKSLAMKTGAGAGATGLLLLGVIGNRGRRKVKLEAEELLEFRQEEMKGTVDRLFKLMDRAAVVLGAESELGERGYRGETLAVSQRGLAEVDEAFVLSSHVQRIISEGEALVHAQNPISGVQNFFTRGRYEKAVMLLDQEVLCRPSEPPLLPGAAAGRVPKRLSDGSNKDFTVELPEWKSRMDQTMDSAEAAIDRVDIAWATMIPRSEVLAKDIETLEGLKEEIVQRSEEGWFTCVAVFAGWLMAMKKSLEDGLALGKGDPVSALDGDINRGERMVKDGLSLVQGILEFRRARWQGMGAAEEELSGRGRATVWVDHGLDHLSETAEKLAAEGEQKSVAEQVGSYGRSLDEFADRLESAAMLSKRADEVSLPAIEAAEELVNATRLSLAGELSLPAAEVLVEGDDLNPTVYLNESRNQRSAALAALDRGEALAASGFLDEGDELTDRAEALVNETQMAFDKYDAERAALIADREELNDATSSAKETVQDLRSRYAARALAFDPEESTSGSYGDAPTRLDEALALVLGLLDDAEKSYRTAALLKARSLLREGDARVKDGDALCLGVSARCDELAAMEVENKSQLADRQREQYDLEKQSEDRRVTQETLTLLAQATASMHEACGVVEAEPVGNDPYLAEDLLDDCGVRLAVVSQAIIQDRERYQEAAELLEVVKVSREQSEKLAEAARTDQIPDSVKTTECIDRIAALREELDQAGGGLEEDHGDWSRVQQHLRDVHHGYGQVSVELREELRLAQEAIRAIASAEREVRRAENWRGSYGVRVSSFYGSAPLTNANLAIANGNYHDCLSHAGMASSRARSAIAAAEAEVAAKRRAAAAAAAARRRRSSSSSFSSHSSGSSFSSSSRSSSVGRSSFSSGSGVGRSGW